MPESAIDIASSAIDIASTVWMFQYNPRYWDLETHLRDTGVLEWWQASQHRDRMRAGQRVYIRRSGGPHAVLEAVGMLLSSTYRMLDHDHDYDGEVVDLIFEARINPPFTLTEVRAVPELADYRPLGSGHFATNFILPPQVAAITYAVTRDRWRPIESTEVPPVDPTVDNRKRVLAEVVRRRGQPEFRAQLLQAYENRCAVTGCNAVDALEAAHIQPYRGEHTNQPTNGLLLRSDIHTLFDLGQLAIDTTSMHVVLASDLEQTTYAELAGSTLRLPVDAALHPNRTALNEHYQRSKIGQAVAAGARKQPHR